MTDQKTDESVTRSTVRESNRRVDSAVMGAISRFHLQHGVVRMLVLTLLAFAIFTAVKPRVFLNPLNLQNIAIAAPEIGLLALAIMLTMLTGGIDLSIVAIANLTAITISSLYTAIGATDAGLAESLAPVIVLVGLAVGAVGGYVNGLLVSRVGITPILATLGTMQIFNGIAITWTGGKTLYGAPAMLTTFGRTVIAGIPALFLVLVAAAIVLAVVINKTALGATIRLQGANPVAARFSGIRTDRTLTSTYVMSGLLAGLAGILFVSRNPTASADYGSSYVLLVIVIAVLGGTNPNGGFGTVLGVILATLTLQIVSSGFNIIRLSSYDYAIAQGAILIIIMVIDQVTSGRRRRTVPKISDALATPTES
ncbi:ABC transporter permease [Cryobacterium tepidiphilum]|nr:ABC transporter permease [Cryobacterium tepidiphilum]